MSQPSPVSFLRTLLLALLCTPALSFACIWINGTTLDGTPRLYSPLMPIQFLERSMKATPQERLDALRSSYQYASEKSSEEERQAVEAMLSNQPLAAVSLLQRIEQTTPGIYSTAANLGTAYELAGDNENALKWITEGIARNKDSHAGTEWLHQRILETKIHLAADPQYLASHRVIPLPEVFNFDTRVKVGDTEHSVREIAWAIGYQLSERMVFVKPPDPVVADILFTYALIEARTAVLESALQYLEKAKLYGFADPTLLQQTIAQYQAIIFRGKIYFSAALILAGGVASVGLYFLFRKRFFLTRAAYLKHREALAERKRK